MITKRENKNIQIKNTTDLISYYTKTWSDLYEYDRRASLLQNSSDKIDMELILNLISKK